MPTFLSAVQNTCLSQAEAAVPYPPDPQGGSFPNNTYTLSLRVPFGDAHNISNVCISPLL